MSTVANLAELAPAFTGQLLQPTDAGYDEARRVHNGLDRQAPGARSRAAAAPPTSPTPSSWRGR